MMAEPCVLPLIDAADPALYASKHPRNAVSPYEPALLATAS